MEGPELTVVRLGHRPGRDERTTTHVALVARAFGASRVIVPATAAGVTETVADVNHRFGGDCTVLRRADPRAYLDGASGDVVHLTMYGLPVQEVVGDLEAASALTVVVGGGKVEGELFELADWNVAVTNQPHSEIAALAVLLDRLGGAESVGEPLPGGTHRIVPSARGKRVESTEE